MQTSQPLSTSTGEEWSPQQPFKIFLIYEDWASFNRGQNLHRELAMRFRREFSVTASSWSFSLLSHPVLRQHALAEAVESDMMVVATEGTHNLPGHIQLWVTDWLTEKTHSHSALVALVNPQPESSLDHCEGDEGLRQMAKDYGVDFFCNRGSTGHEFMPRLLVAVAE